MNFLLVCLFATAFTALEFLKGGARMAYALPCYALLAGAACLSIFHWQRTQISTAFRVCIAASVVLVGYILFSAIVSFDLYLARADFFLAGGALMAYLLCAFHLSSSKLRMGLVALFLALGAVNFGIGAIQFFKGQNYMLFDFLPRSDYGTRASGLYGNPNHLAGFFEITFFFGLAATFWSRWPVYAKIVCGYVTFIIFAGLVFTGSRGGYVGLFLGSVVFVGFSLHAAAKTLRGKRWLIFTAIAVLVLVLGIVATKILAADYMVGERTSKFFVKDVRFGLWHAAMVQFHLSPWLGTGSGTFLYYGRQFRPGDVQTDPIYAHNDYLQLLAEYGIVGVVCLGVFLLVHLHRGIRTLLKVIHHCRRTGNHLDNSLALLLGALSGTAALMFHSLSDFNLHIPVNALLMAFVFAILASQGRGLIENAEAPADLWSRAVWLLLPAFGLWMGIAAGPKIAGEFFNEKSRLPSTTTQPPVSSETAQKAVAYAEQGLKYDPANPALFLNLGQAQYAQVLLTPDSKERERLVEAAIAAYQQAYALTPRDRNVVLYLVSALNVLQRYEVSEPLLQWALELDPNSAEVHLAYGNFFEQRGMLDDALREYKIANRVGPSESGISLMRVEKLIKEATPH